MNFKIGSVTSLSYIPNMVWRDSKMSGRHWFLSSIDIVNEIIGTTLPKHVSDNIKEELSTFAYRYISGIPDQNGPFTPFSKICTHNGIDVMGIDPLSTSESCDMILKSLSLPDFPKEILDFLTHFRNDCETLIEQEDSKNTEFFESKEHKINDKSSNFYNLLNLLLKDTLEQHIKNDTLVSVLVGIVYRLDNDISYYLATQVICFNLNIPKEINVDQKSVKTWKYIGKNLITCVLNSRLSLNKKEKIFFRKQNETNSNVNENRYSSPLYSSFDYIDTNGSHKRLFFDNPYIESHICLYNSIVVNMAKLDELRTILMTKMKNYLSDEKSYYNTFFSKLDKDYPDYSGYNPNGSVESQINIPKFADDIETYFSWLSDQKNIDTSLANHFYEIKELVQTIKTLILSVILEMKNMTKISIVGRPDGISMTNFSTIQDLQKKWVVFIAHSPISSVINTKNNEMGSKQINSFNKSNTNSINDQSKQYKAKNKNDSDSESDSDSDDSYEINKSPPSNTTSKKNGDSTIFQSFKKEFSIGTDSKNLDTKHGNKMYCEYNRYEIMSSTNSLSKVGTKNYINRQKLISEPDNSKFQQYTEIEKKIMSESKLFVVFGCQKYWLETDLHDPNRCHKCQITIWDGEREQKFMSQIPKFNNKNWKTISTIEKAKDYYTKYNHPYFVSNDKKNTGIDSDLLNSQKLQKNVPLTNSYASKTQIQDYIRYKGDDQFGHLISDCFPPFLQVSYFERLYKYLQIIETNIDGYFSLFQSVSCTLEFEKNLIVNRFKKITRQIHDDPGWNINVELFENIELTETLFDKKSAVNIIKRFFSEQERYSEQSSASFSVSSNLSNELISEIRSDDLLVSDKTPTGEEQHTDNKIILSSIKSIKSIIEKQKEILVSTSDIYPVLSLNHESSCILTRLKTIKLQNDIFSTMIPTPLYDTFLNYITQPNFLLVDDNVLLFFKNNPSSPFSPSIKISDSDYDNEIGYSSPPIVRLSFKDRISKHFGLNHSANIDTITYNQFKKEIKERPESIEDVESNSIYSSSEIELEKYGYMWAFRQTNSKNMTEYLVLKSTQEKKSDNTNQSIQNNITTSSYDEDNPFKEPNTTSSSMYSVTNGMGILYKSLSHVGSFIPNMYKSYSGDVNMDNPSTNSLHEMTNEEKLQQTTKNNIDTTLTDENEHINGEQFRQKTKNSERYYPQDFGVESNIEEIKQENNNKNNSSLGTGDNSTNLDTSKSTGHLSHQQKEHFDDEDYAIEFESNIDKKIPNHNEYLTKDLIAICEIQQLSKQILQKNNSDQDIWQHLQSDPLLFIKNQIYELCLLSNFYSTINKISNIKTIINTSVNYIKETFRTYYFNVISKENMGQSLLSLFFKHPYLTFRNSELFLEMNGRTALSRTLPSLPNVSQNDVTSLPTYDDMIIDPIYDMVKNSVNVKKKLAQETENIIKLREEYSQILFQIKILLIDSKIQNVNDKPKILYSDEIYCLPSMVIHKSLLAYNEQKNISRKNKSLSYQFIVGVIKKQ